MLRPRLAQLGHGMVGAEEDVVPALPPSVDGHGRTLMCNSMQTCPDLREAPNRLWCRGAVLTRRWAALATTTPALGAVGKPWSRRTPWFQAGEHTEAACRMPNVGSAATCERRRRWQLRRCIFIPRPSSLRSWFRHDVALGGPEQVVMNVIEVLKFCLEPVVVHACA